MGNSENRSLKSIEQLEDPRLSTNQVLREKISNITLLCITIVGTLFLLFNLWRYISNAEWIVVVLYSLIYLWILFVTINRKLPYRIRALSILFILGLVAVISTITGVLSGSERLWFLAFTMYSAILFNLSSAFLVLIFSLIVYLGIGGAVSSGYLIPYLDVNQHPNTDFSDWLMNGLIFALLTAAIMIASSALIARLKYTDDSPEVDQDVRDPKYEELQHRLRRIEHSVGRFLNISDIAHSIVSVYQSNTMFQQIVDALQEHLGLYFVGIYLLDAQSDHAVLKAGSGDAGLQMVAEGQQFALDGTSLVSWSILHRRAEIAADLGEGLIRLDNPLLLQTNSEMVLPIIAGNQVLGAISFHSDQPNAFNKEDIKIFQTIADTLAIAMLCSQQHENEKKLQQEIEKVHQRSTPQGLANTFANVKQKHFSYSSDPDIEPTEGFPSVNIPIILREQEIGDMSLGLLPDELNPEDRTFIDQVTYQAALAIENVRLLEETQRLAKHERLVAEIVKKARTSADVSTILRTTLGELGRSLRADEGRIWLERPTVPAAMKTDGSGE